MGRKSKVSEPYIRGDNVNTETQNKIAEITVHLQAVQYGLDQVQKLAEELAAAKTAMRSNVDNITKLLASLSFETPQIPKEELKAPEKTIGRTAEEVLNQERTRQEPISAQAAEQLPSSAPTEPLPDKLNIEFIIWEGAKGRRGEYEKAIYHVTSQLTGAQITSNGHYQLLEQQLSARRTETINGVFYWLFENEKAIGRKPVKGRR
jgi:hypothetical protein